MIARSNKNKKIGQFSNIFFSTLLGLFLLIILVFLVITNIKIGERRKTVLLKIEDFKAEIQDLREKNEKLKENISQSGTWEYLEKVAREQFNLKMPGEEVVVISKDKKQEDKEEVKPLEEKKNFWNPLNWLGWIKSKF